MLVLELGAGHRPGQELAQALLQVQMQGGVGLVQEEEGLGFV